MANQRIDQLNSETAPAASDLLPIYSISGSDTKKITVQTLIGSGVALISNGSIPVAKVNLSGISGTNLTDGTVAIAKLNTSGIPVASGLTAASGILGLVAPTSPIQRNGSTGSLEHANSTVASGVWTKVTVDAKGHVTSGTTLLGTDVPLATASVVGVISPGTGLSVTGAGVLNHSNSLASGITVNGVTVDQQGHVTGIVALASTDLPKASAGVRGAVSPGTGTSVNGDSVLSVTAATSSTLGGVIVGSDFAVNAGTISLIQRAGLTNNASYPKVTVTDRGIVTAGASLTSVDIPALDTSKITSGTLSIDRYGANTITGAKLANYAIGKISEAFPTADYISQLYFNPLDRTLYMWDGNVFQPIGVSYGQVVFSGTYDAGTNLITSVTTEGAAIGLTVGGALTAPVTANKSHYVVVDQPGTGTAPAPAIALSPPDMLLSNGTTWVLLDVSDTVTAQLASNIQVSPAGNIASTNVQSALQELDDEKLPLAGGTLTGNLALNTGIAIVYEGATTDNFETTLYVVDPTADRTILLPNVSGTVVTTGDTGTVTSTMLLDGTILNEDINASAAIVDTKLATIATAGKVSNSATTATSANTTSAIVARDASGNFTAGTITAALTGAASSNVLKAGDTMTGVLAVTAGTAALPAITPSGDPNTGIYSPGADQLAISTSGTSRLDIDASGNIAVDTNTLYVDAVNNRVGIGDSSPSEKLTINGNVAFNTNNQFIKFNSFYGSPFTGSMGSILAFNPAYAAEVAAINFYQTGGNTADILFRTGLAGSSTERMRIDSSGRVGIGTTSPGGTLDIKAAASTHPLIVQGPSSEFARIDSSGRLLVGTSNYTGNSKFVVAGLIGGDVGLLDLRYTGSRPTVADITVSEIRFGSSDLTANTAYARIIAESDGASSSGSDIPGRLVFSTTADGASSPTEQMRIDSSGRTGFGIAPNAYGDDARITIQGTNVTRSIFSNINGTGSGTHITFGNGNGGVGSITTSGSSTAYNTSSDYRLKENVASVTDGITRLQQLKPSRFNFIVDPDKTVDGFLAHEVQTVVPEAITGEKDAVDDQGNPIYQGIDQSKLVPLLTAALQEAIGRIETLEAEVAALKAQ